MRELVGRLQGPLLVLGGSGFIGANLLRTLLTYRDDVFGTTTRLPAWRLDGLPPDKLITTDLLIDSNLDALLDTVQPRTILDCVAYGAYSFETDSQLIYQTNFNFVSRLLARLEKRRIAAYIHAGSSSEYGFNASGPTEDAATHPNSHYAVSKVSAANLIYFYGKKLGLPSANLRLYSVYGPLEDASRLIPNLVRHGVEHQFPEFVDPEISRDFLYIDDAVEAFLHVAVNLTGDDYGESFNIGSGCKMTIRDCAMVAKELYHISDTPVFTMRSRQWDLADWYANIGKIRTRMNWLPRVGFREGLAKTTEWYRGLSNPSEYFQASKLYGVDTKYSVSAIVACYRDSQAVPVMYQRLKTTFEKLRIDHEIIFVNDGSPDDSEEVIRGISRNDRRVRGITHSRNFGSQAAFRSGMEISTKNACVLLDGDLQDPPELIGQMVAKWREGYDVVYGRRIKREAPLLMQWSYKLFYRMFDAFSYLKIPHDAGDFSLMDRRVVKALLTFPERDLFVRGVRAYAGFRQTGIDYVRPERMFGTTTNNLAKNIGWAKKGILSFSYVPLSMLSTAGFTLFGLSICLGLFQLLARLLFPGAIPKSITTVLLLILFFGSLNLFALSLIGEYIAKIFEEVKRRPHFIRHSIIKDGEVRFAAISGDRTDEP